MWASRALAALVALFVLASVSVTSARAIDFTIDERYGEAAAATKSECPTLTAPPRSVEAWFNTDDMDSRGYLDPKNQRSWSFANKIAQLVCGAKAKSKIEIGMYFIRAIGTSERPESDSEIVWKAMEYVHKKRGVSIGIVLDKGSITPNSLKNQIKKRLKGVASLYWCSGGCFNTNTTLADVNSVSINHEKFMAISDTIWAKDGKKHPLVYSSSGQFARSQVRGYWQEATLLYGDSKLYKHFSDRYYNMKVCATSGSKCRAGKFKSSVYAGGRDTLVNKRGIWVDSVYRHYTDAGRGTTVSFSPQSQTAAEFYLQQLGNVDCTVDNKIRIAMYRLTDSRSVQFVRQVVKLKKAGCDVRVLLSQTGGAQTISKDVVKLLRNAKLTDRVRCTALPTHTKLVLISPTSNSSGRIMFGTSNMTTAGLRYSDEHTITIDSRRASGQYSEDIKRVFGTYSAGWEALSQGSKKCH
jgi:hypothetical protein